MHGMTNIGHIPLDVLRDITERANNAAGTDVFVRDEPLPPDFDHPFYDYAGAVAEKVSSMWAPDRRDLSAFWREWERLRDEWRKDPSKAGV